MTRPPHTKVSTRGPQAAFADAIHSLSSDPTGENVVRYLLASRELQRAQDAMRRDAKARRARKRGSGG